MNKFIRTFFIFFLIVPYIACSEDYQKIDQVLKTENSNFSVYVEYANKTDKIVKNFYMVKEGITNEKLGTKLIDFRDGLLTDKNQKVIIDLRNHKPAFFGFTLEVSYPKNKRYSPGFYLEPHFGTGEQVGDAIIIQWDEKNGTFVKRTYDIP